MNTLPSLNDYAGQTLDELIDLYGRVQTFSINFAIERALNLRFGHGDSPKLSHHQRVILAVQNIEREVMNGGFSQFFVNTSGSFAYLIVSALEQIDCPKTANLARLAIKSLGISDLTVTAIHEAVVNGSPELEDALNALDQEFFKYEEPIDEKLFAWIVANRDSIQIS